MHLILIFSVALLAGCATSAPPAWQHEGGSYRGAWHRAYDACAERVPVKPSSSVIPRERMDSSMVAIPWTGETRPAFVACMNEAGWKLQ